VSDELPIAGLRNHGLKGRALSNEGEGIIGRCLCGWSTGHRFSGFAASVAFRDHLEDVERLEPAP